MYRIEGFQITSISSRVYTLMAGKGNEDQINNHHGAQGPTDDVGIGKRWMGLS